MIFNRGRILSPTIGQEEVPLTLAHREDLQNRIAVYEANPKMGSTWEEVKARLLEKP